VTPGRSLGDIVLRRHDAAETLRLKDHVLRVYGTSHAEPIRRDPWLSEARFWKRLTELYAPGRDFAMVSAWHADEMIGYAFGSPRDNAATTWEQVRAACPDFPAPALSEPIYIFREFAVHPDHQGKGYGRQLHDALLHDRTERLACLYVRTENEQAIGAYTSWGWKTIATEQPFADSPVLYVMTRILPALGPGE
jgi:GNAT superfamily N-acetyltransferase